MQITNNFNADLKFCDDHIAAKGATIDMDPKVWASIAETPVIQAWVNSGMILIDGVNEDPAPKAKKGRKTNKRKELEEQAKEIDVQFSAKTSDEDLEAAIERALHG